MYVYGLLLLVLLISKFSYIRYFRTFTQAPFLCFYQSGSLTRYPSCDSQRCSVLWRCVQVRHLSASDARHVCVWLRAVRAAPLLSVSRSLQQNGDVRKQRCVSENHTDDPKQLFSTLEFFFFLLPAFTHRPRSPRRLISRSSGGYLIRSHGSRSCMFVPAVRLSARLSGGWLGVCGH